MRMRIHDKTNCVPLARIGKEVGIASQVAGRPPGRAVTFVVSLLHQLTASLRLPAPHREKSDPIISLRIASASHENNYDGL